MSTEMLPRGGPKASPTILVVSDDRDLRRLIRSELEALGTVIDLEDPDEALRLAAGILIDLTVADHGLPGMGGGGRCERDGGAIFDLGAPVEAGRGYTIAVSSDVQATAWVECRWDGRADTLARDHLTFSEWVE